MANEVSFSGTLRATKNSATVQSSVSDTADMSADALYSATQSVGTSAEAITLGEVSSLGYVLVQNLDSTNYVELSLDNSMTQKFSKLLAGQFALFPSSTATLYARANTAACLCQVTAVSL